jgi:uncharacterized protein DUF6130
MHMIKALRLTAMCAVITLAMAGFAADRPSLTIESPEKNATVQPTPGLGDVVVIKFRADNFKMTGFNEPMASHHSATMPDNQPASQSSAKSEEKPMSENPPQTEQSAAGNQPALPQSDQSPTASTSTIADQGYIQASVDRGKWYWVHSSNDPIVLVGLPKGDHTVKLELVDSSHKSIGVSQSVNFTVSK